MSVLPTLITPLTLRLDRRAAMLRCLGAATLCGVGGPAFARPRTAAHAPPDPRWFAAALAMRRLAESAGDQPYGAVLVRGERLIGEAPSRVVARGDPTAHAEREALADARRRHGASALEGSVLYSTSKPCRECEAAAAAAGVSRMVFGADLQDAGRPRS